MDKLDAELDQFYVAQIAQLMQLSDDIEKMIQFYERRRKVLRYKNDRKRV